MKGLILFYVFSVILLFINSESETYVILEYIIRLNNHLVEYLLKHLYLHIKSSCCCFFNLLSSCPFFYPHAFFSSIHMPSSLLFYPHAFFSSIHMPSSLLFTCLPLFYPHAFLSSIHMPSSSSIHMPSSSSIHMPSSSSSSSSSSSIHMPSSSSSSSSFYACSSLSFFVNILTFIDPLLSNLSA